MATTSVFSVNVPYDIYQQFISEGATEVHVEVLKYDDGEYEAEAVATFTGLPDKREKICPKPCFQINI